LWGNFFQEVPPQKTTLCATGIILLYFLQKINNKAEKNDIFLKNLFTFSARYDMIRDGENF
jgi:hypothetical protein